LAPACGAAACLALAVLAHAEVASELLGLPLADVQFDIDAPVDKQALRLLLPLEVGKPLLADDVQRARELLELTDVFRAVEFDAGRVDDSVVLHVRLLRKRVIENVRVEGVRTLWTETSAVGAGLIPAWSLSRNFSMRPSTASSRTTARSGSSKRR